jgi:hypothetical protein
MEEAMKTSTLFIINFVVALVFGLAFVLIPGSLLSLYGVALSDAGLFVSRLLGAAFIGFAIISWMFRFTSESGELRAILLTFFVSDIIGFIISLIYQLQGVANALGWSTVAIYLLLGLGFGYFYLRTQG